MILNYVLLLWVHLQLSKPYSANHKYILKMHKVFTYIIIYYIRSYMKDVFGYAALIGTIILYILCQSYLQIKDILWWYNFIPTYFKYWYLHNSLQFTGSNIPDYVNSVLLFFSAKRRTFFKCSKGK